MTYREPHIDLDRLDLLRDLWLEDVGELSKSEMRDLLRMERERIKKETDE